MMSYKTFMFYIIVGILLGCILKLAIDLSDERKAAMEYYDIHLDTQ